MKGVKAKKEILRPILQRAGNLYGKFQPISGSQPLIILRAQPLTPVKKGYDYERKGQAGGASASHKRKRTTGTAGKEMWLVAI